MKRRLALTSWLVPALLAIAAFSIVLSFLWPIHGKPWGSFYQEFFAAFALIPLLLSVVMGKGFRCTVSIYILLAASFIPLFQYYALKLFHYSGDAWLSAFYVQAFAAACFLGVNAKEFKGGVSGLVSWVSGVILLAGMLSALIALRQWLQVADSNFEIGYFGARPYANLAQPNHLAGLLCLALVSLLYFYESKILGKATGTALALILFAGLALTQSRTPWVISVVFLFVWIWRSNTFTFRLSIKGFVCWMVVFAAMTLFKPILSNEMGLLSNSVGDRAGAGGRLDIWVWSLKVIAQSPSTGYGWLQTPVVQMEFLEIFPLKGVLTFSHNVVLDLLIWNGPWIGGVLVLLGGLWIIGLRRLPDGLNKSIALFGVVVFIVHATLEYPHAYLYFLIPAGLFFGIVDGATQWKYRCNLHPVFSSISILAAFVVLSILLREYQLFEKNAYNQRLSDAKVVGFEQEDLRGGVIILSQLEALQAFRRTDISNDMSKQDLSAMGQVNQRYPHLSNLYRYTLALYLDGYYKEAIAQLSRIRAIYGEKFYLMAFKELESDVLEISGDPIDASDLLNHGEAVFER